MTTVMWFRRDLRVQDNAALYHALTSCRQVYCAFVFDREILDTLPRADRRVEFIRESLVDLNAQLQALGLAHSGALAGAHAGGPVGLLLRHDHARCALPALAAKLAVDAVFINHDGMVNPSGFLPIPLGNVREASIVDLYRDHPVMRGLRNPEGFKGRCGVCEYARVCGGSRARAYAWTGDPLEADPLCPYVPSGTLPAYGMPAIAATA